MSAVIAQIRIVRPRGSAWLAKWVCSLNDNAHLRLELLGVMLPDDLKRDGVAVSIRALAVFEGNVCPVTRRMPPVANTPRLNASIASIAKAFV